MVSCTGDLPLSEREREGNSFVRATADYEGIALQQESPRRKPKRARKPLRGETGQEAERGPRAGPKERFSSVRAYKTCSHPGRGQWCGHPAIHLGKRVQLGAENPVGGEVGRELVPEEQRLLCFLKQTQRKAAELWALSLSLPRQPQCLGQDLAHLE